MKLKKLCSSCSGRGWTLIMVLEGNREFKETHQEPIRCQACEGTGMERDKIKIKSS